MSNLQDTSEPDKLSEDMTFIGKNLISMIKSHKYLYDLTENTKDDDEIKNFIITKTYESIAVNLTKLMEDRFASNHTETRYIFTGEFVSWEWETYKKLLQIAVQEKDYSWVLYEDMKFFKPYVIVGYLSETDELVNEHCLMNKSSNKRKKRLMKSVSESESVSSCSSDTVEKEPKKEEPKKVVPKSKLHEPNNKLYRFKLSQDDIALVKKVEKNPAIYMSTFSNHKNKTKRLITFHNIGVQLYGKTYMDQHIGIGAELEKQWNNIRKKCTYAFKLGKKTDQDDLLLFMKKVINPKNSSQVPSFAHTKVNIPEDDEKSKPEEKESLLEDDHLDLLTWGSEEETGLKSNQNGAESKDENKDFKQELQSEKFESCRIIMRESFNELKKDHHMQAMIHLCKKIEEYAKNISEILT